MHVGSLNLYELPAGFKGSFHKALQAHIAKRMHLAPVFSRKLAFMPFDLGHPLWVEADEVDLDFHIRKVKGATMTVKQAEAMAAKLHGKLIDREHPLWEFYVFDSIKPPPGLTVRGKLVGFYSKIHHAALDGKGGTVLANAVLDLGPVPRDVPPPDPARKRRTAGDLKIGEMIGAVFSNSLTQYAKLARSLPSAASSLGGTQWHANRSRAAARESPACGPSHPSSSRPRRCSTPASPRSACLPPPACRSANAAPWPRPWAARSTTSCCGSARPPCAPTWPSTPALPKNR
jgi:diacylglycerol O-acyltransferase